MSAGDGTSVARDHVQMWNVVRGPMGREGVTAKDLVLYGSTDTDAVKPSAAANFIKHLSKAGYLVCVRPPKVGTAAVWRLKPNMNSGPKPPMVVRVVYDPNRSKFVGPIEVYETLP